MVIKWHQTGTKMTECLWQQALLAVAHLGSLGHFPSLAPGLDADTRWG